MCERRCFGFGTKLSDSDIGDNSYFRVRCVSFDNCETLMCLLVNSPLVSIKKVFLLLLGTASNV